MRNIPARFTLMGRDYTVSFDDIDDDCDAIHDFNSATIKLRKTNTQGEWAYFGHELAHALLEAAGRDDLSDDEKFVDVLGQLIHQFLKTAKGDINKNAKVSK